ncbi:MAG: helix-turn-helix transcriptional regulator, partial [Kiritimatiellia bacterium]
MNKIVREKGGYNFAEALEHAKTRLAYYEEGLFVEVAARIVDAMESRGLSRSALARKLNVSPAYITKILRGHANLSLESLAKLAFALDLKWECILIPKKAKVGVLSLADESGNCAICAVERATVTALGEPIPAEEEAYAE